MTEESQYSIHPNGWIEWFCSLEEHQFLCEIDEEFIRDQFNQYGIKTKQFKEAFKMILQPNSPNEMELENDRFIETYEEAVSIYTILHSRFIQTPKGSAIMREKHLQGEFGHCPRIYCNNQQVIPLGLLEQSKNARVKIFCPRCEEVYNPKKKYEQLDGAYFGRSFPQFLLMTFPDLNPKFQLLPDSIMKPEYEPILFGFKIVGKTGSRLGHDHLKCQCKHSYFICGHHLMQQIENNVLSYEKKQFMDSFKFKQLQQINKKL